MKSEEQFALILSKLEEQIKEIAESNKRISEVRDSVEDLKTAKGELELWRPKVENTMTNLHATVADLQNQLSKLAMTDAGGSTAGPSKDVVVEVGVDILRPGIRAICPRQELPLPE